MCILYLIKLTHLMILTVCIKSHITRKLDSKYFKLILILVYNINVYMNLEKQLFLYNI